MGFIKKKLFLIICVLFFLVGVGIFVYGMGISGDNAKEFSKIEGQYSKVRGLNKVMVVNNIRSQHAKNAQVARTDAQAILTLAKETTLRPLLSNEVFPKPTGSSPDIKYQKFALTYCRIVEGYLSRLNAGQRPSLAEEDKVEQSFLDNTVTDTGRGMNRMSDGGQVDTLIEDLRRQRSQEVSVYAGEQEFMAYDYWNDYDAASDRTTQLLDTWFTQLAHWIQEDIVLTIQQVNGESQAVITSPVKRLIEVSFGGPKAGPGAGLKSGNTSRDRRGGRVEVVSRRVENSVDLLPEYVMTDKNGIEGSPALGEMTNAWTRRTSDSLVDVVHFEVAVIIDSRSVNDFINALQGEKTLAVNPADGSVVEQNRRSQITVLQLQHEPVDVDNEQESGYYYGQASLTSLRAVCEYLFFRTGYEPLMPEPVLDIFEQENSMGSSRR